MERKKKNKLFKIIKVRFKKENKISLFEFCKDYEIVMHKGCFIAIKLIFIIFSIIFLYIKFNRNINNNINYNLYKDIIGFEDYKKELKEIFNVTITNSSFNDGFLEINTTHKGNYTYYDYTSNIIIYKDLYNNILYTPITENNYILYSNQISKEDFSKICEEGVLLDTTKYKRNKKPKISVVIPYFNKGNVSITMCLR